MIDEPEVVVVPSAADGAQVAALRIATALRDAVAARGVAHWVTTGGSTPGPIYRDLADEAMRGTIPWDRVHLWWGDERWVPPDDVLSNALVCWDVLVRDVPVPPDQVHVMPIGDALAAGQGPADVAERYAATVRSAGPPADGPALPRFDVVLVGIGTDGHLFSVFPGSPTWDDPRWVQAVPAPTHIAPHVARVTLHPGFVTAARLPIAVVHGAAKAPVLERIFGPRPDPRALPAALARRTGALWILDEAAASGMPAELRGASAR